MTQKCLQWVAFGRGPDGDVALYIADGEPIAVTDDRYLSERCERLQVDPADIWWTPCDELDSREQSLVEAFEHEGAWEAEDGDDALVAD